MTRALTTDEVLALDTATVDLVTAARAVGVGRNTAYEQAAEGTFPVRLLRVGVQWRCPTADLRRVLGLGPPDSSEAGESAPANATTSESASHQEVEVSPT